MNWVDSNSPIAVHGMFEELNRDHREAEPLPLSMGRAQRHTAQPPRPHLRPSRSFWELTRDEARVAELCVLLAPPDIHAPLLPLESAPSLERHAAGPSLAPVAMPSSSALVCDLTPASSAGARVHWLAPASAGVFALGAVVATGWLQLQTGLAMARDPGPTGVASPSMGVAAVSLTQDLLRPERLTRKLLPSASEEPGQAAPLPLLAETDPLPPDAAERALARLRELAERARARASIGRARSLGASPGRGGHRSPSAHPAAPAAGEVPNPVELEGVAARLPFDKAAAVAALRLAATSGRACMSGMDTAHTVPVSVTFAPSGRSTSAQVGGSLAGTSQGSCVARNMRSARVPAFEGGHVTVTKTVRYR